MAWKARNLRRSGSAAVAAPPVWESPATPLPDNLSLQDLRTVFASWSVGGQPPGHLDVYVADSLHRFLHTWGMVRDDRGACLELGANPYFTTYLLDHHTELQTTLGNYFGSGGQITESVSWVPLGSEVPVEEKRVSYLFNTEEDSFPFPSGTFDVVLFCEIIEHLLMDPIHALLEIHRVLRPGGALILTTPNVCRLYNVHAMVTGSSIYDPYSGFGPYGRHNREYTRHELHHLLEFCGYEVDYSLTADGHRWDPAALPLAGVIAPLVAFRQPDLGQYLFVRARATKQPRAARPSWLYRSRPDGEIVEVEL